MNPIIVHHFVRQICIKSKHLAFLSEMSIYNKENLRRVEMEEWRLQDVRHLNSNLYFELSISQLGDHTHHSNTKEIQFLNLGNSLQLRKKTFPIHDNFFNLK